jgi:hypothetical protein
VKQACAKSATRRAIALDQVPAPPSALNKVATELLEVEIPAPLDSYGPWLGSHVFSGPLTPY